MRSDIVPGGIFPDYELPDHTGKVRKLSELQGDDPLILTLARGHYCCQWRLKRGPEWRGQRAPDRHCIMAEKTGHVKASAVDTPENTGVRPRR